MPALAFEITGICVAARISASAASVSAPAPKNPFTIDEEDVFDDEDGEEARYRSTNDDEEAGPLASSSSRQPPPQDLGVVAVAPRGALRREASDGLVLDSPLAVSAAGGSPSSSSFVPTVPPEAGGGAKQQQQPGFDSVDLR